MNYEQARTKIRSGDLLAWSHRAWKSWYDIQIQGVRFFTQSEYCHVGIAYRNQGRPCVIEAVGSGVRFFPLSRLLPFYYVPLKLKWTEEAEEFAWNTLGDPYSKFQAVKAHLGWLRAGTDNTWECAEHSQALLFALGFPTHCKPTPTELVRSAQAQRGASMYLIEN